ncbi:MAG: hypothetical protein M1830_006919, partial [Pleopsidium flavum]
MKKKKPDQEVGIFNDGALRITQSAAKTCQGIFQEIEAELMKAYRQISGKNSDGDMVVLSRAERMRWPFLQPGIEGLRAELEKSKGTLMLVLQVTTLGYTEALAKANKPANMTVGEKEQLIHSIEALEKTVHGQKRLQASGGISPQSSVRPQWVQPDVVITTNSRSFQGEPSDSGQEASQQDLDRQTLPSSHQHTLGGLSDHHGYPQMHAQEEAEILSDLIDAIPTAPTVTGSASILSPQRVYDHNDNKQGLTENHQSQYNLPTRNHVQSTPTNPIRVPASAEASKQGSVREEEEERSACGDMVNQPKGGADIVTQTTKQSAQNRDLLTDAKLEHIGNRLLAEPPSDAVSDKG